MPPPTVIMVDQQGQRVPVPVSEASEAFNRGMGFPTNQPLSIIEPGGNTPVSISADRIQEALDAGARILPTDVSREVVAEQYGRMERGRMNRELEEEYGGIGQGAIALTEGLGQSLTAGQGARVAGALGGDSEAYRGRRLGRALVHPGAVGAGRVLAIPASLLSGRVPAAAGVQAGGRTAMQAARQEAAGRMARGNLLGGVLGAGIRGEQAVAGGVSRWLQNRGVREGIARTAGATAGGAVGGVALHGGMRLADELQNAELEGGAADVSLANLFEGAEESALIGAGANALIVGALSSPAFVRRANDAVDEAWLRVAGDDIARYNARHGGQGAAAIGGVGRELDILAPGRTPTQMLDRAEEVMRNAERDMHVNVQRAEANGARMAPPAVDAVNGSIRELRALARRSSGEVARLAREGIAKLEELLPAPQFAGEVRAARQARAAEEAAEIAARGADDVVGGARPAAVALGDDVAVAGSGGRPYTEPGVQVGGGGRSPTLEMWQAAAPARPRMPYGGRATRRGLGDAQVLRDAARRRQQLPLRHPDHLPPGDRSGFANVGRQLPTQRGLQPVPSLSPTVRAARPARGTLPGVTSPHAIPGIGGTPARTAGLWGDVSLSGNARRVLQVRRDLDQLINDVRPLANQYVRGAGTLKDELFAIRRRVEDALDASFNSARMPRAEQAALQRGYVTARQNWEAARAIASLLAKKSPQELGLMQQLMGGIGWNKLSRMRRGLVVGGGGYFLLDSVMGGIITGALFGLRGSRNARALRALLSDKALQMLGARRKARIIQEGMRRELSLSVHDWKPNPRLMGTVASAVNVEDYDEVADRVRRTTTNPAIMRRDAEEDAQQYAEGSPEGAAEVVAQSERAIEALQDALPKGITSPTLLTHKMDPNQLVSDAERAAFMRFAHAVDNPLSIMEDIKSGMLTFETVDAIREVYPALYDQVREGIVAAIQGGDSLPPYGMLLQLGTLFPEVPTVAALDPSMIQLLQAPYMARETGSEGGKMSQGPGPAPQKPAPRLAKLEETRVQQIDSQ